MLASRTAALVAITGGILLPLSFLERCDQLKFTSAVGVCGVFYYIAAIAFRYLQGSYCAGGSLDLQIPAELRASFGTRAGPFSWTGGLVMVSMLTSAYVCHYNAPKFFRELKDRTLKRFNIVVFMGFGLATAVYIVGMGASFLTFGGHSGAFIFNNYATRDPLFVVARAIVSLVILCTYPLLFIGTRDGAMELMPIFFKGVQAANVRHRRRVTCGLVALLAALGLGIKDIGVIVAVPGALMGSAVVYIFPSIMFLAATAERGDRLHAAGGEVKPLPFWLRLERGFCKSLILIGCLLAACGTATSLGLGTTRAAR